MPSLKVILLQWLTILACWTLGVSCDCPAPRPCLCLNDVIDCSGHALTAIPYMTYQRSEHFHTLAFNNNNLTSINASVFSNLNITRLLLHHNKISDIAPAAFNAIEGILIELNLAHNNLRYLPVSIGYLRTLNILDVSHNPMDGERRGSRPHKMVDDFTDDVLRELGDTLTSFTFGDEIQLSHWPKSLHHAIQLESLYLTGSTMNYMRSGWFHGFEHTLKTLSIKDFRLLQIPLDLAELTQLTELHIDNNQYEYGDSILVDPPFIGIADTLTTLTLTYDNLTVFPEVIRHLTKVQNFSLEGNDLLFISEEAVSFMKNTRVRFLSLRNCGLKRIPGAISDLKNLVELDLAGNLIKTIEAPDIIRMPVLQRVTLANNPIRYISRSAFRGLSSLTMMDMSESELTVLPKSIQNLRNLQVMDLTNSRVDCTCDLFWVKRWMVFYEKNVTFLGDCETINQSVDRYINYRIPTCLQYTSP